MRYLAWTALPFSAAVFLCCILPAWWLCWVMAAACLLIALPVIMHKKRDRLRYILLTIGVGVGCLWFGVFTAANALPKEKYDGQEIGFTATVISYPVEEDWGVTFALRMDSGSAQGHTMYAMTDLYYVNLKPGDRLTGTATMKAALSQSDSSYYTANGEFLFGWVDVSNVTAVGEVPLGYFPQWLGHTLKQTIRTLLPGEEGALLQGLLTGDKSALSDDTYSDFRRTGMAHLLAVSGLHVSFLSGVLYVLPGQKRRRIFVVLPVFVCFALLTGGQPSVWRAVVMASLMLIAPLVNRENDPVTSLSLALFLLLLHNPYASLGVGLQLSFAAVAGLACFHTKLYDWFVKPFKGKARWKVRYKVWRLIAGSLATSLSAMVFTLPLVAWHFGTVSLASPIANLLCIWVASVAFGLGMLLCVLAWFAPPLAQLLAVAEGYLLRWLLWVADCLSRGNFTSLRLDNLYYLLWFLALLIIIGLLIALKPLRRRPVLPIASAILLFFLAINLRMVSLQSPALTVTALNVGQGSCTVFGSGGTFAAVDCGGSEAGDLLADYIQSAGKNELALLVLTHYDKDHTNGVEQLLERIHVSRVAVSPVSPDEDLLNLLENNGCEVVFVDGYMTAEFGEASLNVMPPVSDEGSNTSSLSVLCSWNGHHTLVTGDLAVEQELLLMGRENLPDLDVLIVGHHGSATSTSARLLAELKPECALISAGKNQYNIPSVEVLERLRSYRCTIYRTDRNGSVTIRYH